MYLTGSQSTLVTVFQPFAHIYRWDGEFNSQNISENFYDQNILTFGPAVAPDPSEPGGQSLPFNFCGGSPSTGNPGTFNVSTNFDANVGMPITQTSDGNPIKAVGVAFGIKINVGSTGWLTGEAGELSSLGTGLSVSKVRLKFG